jgi:hypothetical protein
VATAKKRVQMVAANMARVSVLQLDHAFAIPGHAHPLHGFLALVSPARQGQARRLPAATVSQPWGDLERFESAQTHRRSALSHAVNSMRRRVASWESLPGTKLPLHMR